VNTKSIIQRLLQIKGLKKEKDLASLMGLSQGDFSNRKKRDTLIPAIMVWAAQNDIDLNWLIYGKGKEPQEPEPETIKAEPENMVRLDHQDTIAQFPEPRRARDLTRTLLQLAKRNAAAFSEIERYAGELAAGRLPERRMATAGQTRNPIDSPLSTERLIALNTRDIADVRDRVTKVEAQLKMLENALQAREESEQQLKKAASE